MGGKFFKLLIVGGFLLTFNLSSFAQAPDGTVKITSRMVAPGVGLSWGDGILAYKGKEIPFTFQANGLFRDVDASMTAAELSGEVFNLKTIEDFAGNYQKVEAKNSPGGAGTSATMKNQHGVVVNVTSTVAGRKFNLGREGLKVELKKPK